MSLSPGEDYEARQLAEFERDGPEHVRLSLMSSLVYAPDKQQLAVRWLAEKDRAAQVRQANVARRANIRDNVTAGAAIIAAVVSIVGAVIAYDAWVSPKAIKDEAKPAAACAAPAKACQAAP
ncbi:hypothetical protein ACO2Q3_22595 [Caulobacter sp. KR2-114]|uniref:hypothetical protein n=1 Tax=Caulobacter sp. KR2-114 TaxID=3400912 RepID=UPI003BFBE2DA